MSLLPNPQKTDWFRKKQSAKPSASKPSAPAAPSKFTENRTLPVRFGKRGALEYFEQAQLFWKVALASLPLDALLATLRLDLHLPAKTLANLQFASYGLLVAASLFLFRESVTTAIEKLHDFRRFVLNLKLYQSRLILLGIGLVIAVELAYRFGNFGWVAFAAAALIALRAARSVSKTFKKQHERYRALEQDKTLLLDALNAQLFVLSIFPIVTARLAALVSAIVALATSQSLGDWLPVGMTSLVLLLAVMPQEEDFIARCPRCSRWTSRALKQRGYCPVCAREQFQAEGGKSPSS